jgi:hypothetical protein
MSVCTAIYLDRDHEPSAGIFPEKYFRCSAVTDFHFLSPVWDRQLTEVRAAWSPKHLYFHFWALDNLIIARETRPKGRLELDDSLGVYISREPGLYLGWEVNPLGTLAEVRVKHTGDIVQESEIDRSWKSAALLKTERYPSGWAWEIKIPFDKELRGKPLPGDRWKVAFHRNDVDMQGRITLSSWTIPAEGSLRFHSPSTFGELLFG